MNTENFRRGNSVDRRPFFSLKRFFWGGLLVLSLIFLGGYFLLESLLSVPGQTVLERTVEIDSGFNILEIGDVLAREQVVRSKYLFVYYVLKEGYRGQIVAGSYLFPAKPLIADVVSLIVRNDGSMEDVVVTFPEGWTIEEMAERLNEFELPGDEFVSLALDDEGASFRSSFSSLGIPSEQTLEGYLFPDTYRFSADSSAEDIITRMVGNFRYRILTQETDLFLAEREITLHETITMASIVEREVRVSSDRRMVSDLFWRRLELGMLLQSDATVEYARGEKKVQHSIEETRVDSPYNTYVFPGLPPGPISNPGIDSISAVLDPFPNSFLFFLNNPQTGETVFSQTFDEHVLAKSRNGL
ncbi:MAG: endolytic transglycosylase MltG [Candidatus Moranbacteria bacterium]|nr:endolytic transglycosylase MltG [Candidatus Moranbacteria bacterium]